jgi:ubiquinone/menaquinone biosynthesis C-methylase UbiE
MYESERRSRHYYEGRARWYDWANRIAALLRGVSGIRERRKAVRHLGLTPGDRVLEVSVGTGTNLPLIAEHVGPTGRLVGLDISPAMLARCRQKLRHGSRETDLVEGEAAHLPFADHAFDAVFHHGGIAEFGDRRGAIEEMMRVAKPSAKVVICDAGVPTDRKLPLMSRLLMRFQPEYDRPPPVDLIPQQAKDVRLSWFHGDAWYMIELVSP